MDSMMYRFSGPPQVRWKSIPAARVMSAKETVDGEEGFWTRDADPETGATFESVDCGNTRLGNTVTAIPTAANADLCHESFRITEPPLQPFLLSRAGFSSAQQKSRALARPPLSCRAFGEPAPIDSEDSDSRASVRPPSAATVTRPPPPLAARAPCPGHRARPDF